MRQKQRGFNMLNVFLVIAIAIGCTVAWKYYERRQVEEQQRIVRAEQAKALVALETELGKWVDAMKLAGSTSRIALAQPVSSLQAIKRETEGISTPACLAPAKQQLLNGMGLMVDGFIKFMANDYALDETQPEDMFTASAEHFKAYHNEKNGCP